MGKIILTTLVVLASTPSAHAGHFDEVVRHVAGSYWTGTFGGSGAVPTDCAGPITVEFLPSDTVDGVEATFYRHHADFSNANRGPICRQIVAKLSPVRLDGCEDKFPKRWSASEGQNV